MSVWNSIVSNPLLGEELYFNGTAFRASLKASTQATYSLASRWLYAEGQSVKTDPMYTQGDYIYRPASGLDYFVVTVEAEPLAPDIVYLYMIGCNTTVDILRSNGKIPDEDGDLRETWETIHQEVKCFREIVDRSAKQTNDGLMPQVIINLVMPEQYRLSPWDRVVMKSNINGEYKEDTYRVESVGTSLVNRSGNGVVTAQLSPDLRNGS